jgi:hypothetical protein
VKWDLASSNVRPPFPSWSLTQESEKYIY